METQTAPFSNQQIEVMVKDSIQSVFKTMLAIQPTFIGETTFPNNTPQPIPNPIETNQTMLAANVSFTGNVNGAIFLYIEEQLANILTSHMLEKSLDEITEEDTQTVNDCIGELTNMTVGDFKTKLCELNFNCSLSIPSILRDKEFTSQHPTNQYTLRKFYQFTIKDYPLITDLLIQFND